jgi:TrwC relaxase
MSLHKLTAGDGYTYLTRQVAAHDVTSRGRSGLADHYSDRGEQPGRSWGRGLEGSGHGFAGAGSEVTEAQMLALSGWARTQARSRVSPATWGGSH